jgi:hypothetical protein
VKQDLKATKNIYHSTQPAETKINADDEKYRASTTSNEIAPTPLILRPLPNDSSTHEQNYVHI